MTMMYEVGRSAFVYLKLFEHVKLQEPRLASYRSPGDQRANAAFLRSFSEQRVSRVHQAIEAARERAKHAKYGSPGYISNWDTYVISCPICGFDALLIGETQLDADADEDGTLNPYLSFTGGEFECSVCGLKLEDFDELTIAGIDPVLDRTEELGAWFLDEGLDVWGGGRTTVVGLPPAALRTLLGEVERVNDVSTGLS